jgi:hypothetical protein
MGRCDFFLESTPEIRGRRVHSRSTAPDLTSTTAPPVMEFDNEGNFIQGWGGESGPGYQWPSNEHSITVDYKGFVWILGNADDKKDNPANLPNDNQILSLQETKSSNWRLAKVARLAATPPRSSRRRLASVCTPKQTNYGNSRIMVYDADTGKFKRMWGAYGDKPPDLDVSAAISNKR